MASIIPSNGSTIKLQDHKKTPRTPFRLGLMTTIHLIVSSDRSIGSRPLKNRHVKRFTGWDFNKVTSLKKLAVHLSLQTNKILPKGYPDPKIQPDPNGSAKVSATDQFHHVHVWKVAADGRALEGAPPMILHPSFHARGLAVRKCSEQSQAEESDRNPKGSSTKSTYHHEKPFMLDPCISEYLGWQMYFLD